MFRRAKQTEQQAHESTSPDPLVRAATHARLGLPLPRKSRFRFVKRVVARVTWLTNRHQYLYNQSLIQAVEWLRVDVANVPPLPDLAAHTEAHSADLITLYTAAIAAARDELTAQFSAANAAMRAEIVAQLNAAHATDLAALEAALRSEVGATLMRAARQDGEVASASAVAVAATGATLDLRAETGSRFNEVLQRLERLEAGRVRDEARVRVERDDPRSDSVAGRSTSLGDSLGGLDPARFAARFRGAPEMIAARQLELIDFVVGTTSLVVDLGSGRGEWLRLLRDKGMTAIGVDEDATSVQMLRDAGFEAVHSDAITYLRTLADASVGVITSFHMIEHQPFAATVALLREAFRVLIPGGRILVETPNISNLHMGAANFHLDPGHIQPVHPLLLEFTLQEVGFEQVDLRMLHPRPTLETPPAASAQLSLVIESLNQALNGGQDVLATAVRPQRF